MNPDLLRLHPYPFERLARLLDGVETAELSSIALSIGEPRHPPPPMVLEAFRQTLPGVSHYPATRGSDALRESMAGWLSRRFGLANTDTLAAHHILPLNGTREGLFAVAQCLLDRSHEARKVLMPNPFYQIYEGAALLAGCEPSYYAISDDADGDIDAISDTQLAEAQLIYICTPGNPTGAVLSRNALERLIARAIAFDVVIVSDECYTEIYRQQARPPASLLEAAMAMGNDAFSHCLAFHSLSKRSNLPGLRSGFVAGDEALIRDFLRYRTYHGCSMPPPTQAASIVAWDDDDHVTENRRAYDRKFADVVPILADVMQVEMPDAGFYLWPRLDRDEEAFTRELLARANVRVLPGRYLGCDPSASGGGVDGSGNPGRGHLRLALVAEHDDCVLAAERMRELILSS